MKNNHNPSTHVNSLSKAVLEQLATIGSEGDAKTQIVDESGNIIGATSNALDVNVKSDAVGIALDATLTDGSQETKIVDGSGNVIGATSNALDVNIKSGATLEVKLDNENDDVLIYGFDGAANQKIKTHTDGAIQIKAIADSVAVTTDVETGLAKDTTLTGGSQKVKTVDASGVATDTLYRTFSKTVTRPANTTVYTAADVIGDVAGTLDTIADVAKAAGYGVCITNVRIQTTDTGLAGKTIRVHILNDSDTAIADNAAFVIGDAAKRRGYIDVVMGTGNLALEGQTQVENLVVNPVARAVSFILETTEGFTPSGNSTTLKVEIGVILSN